MARTRPVSTPVSLSPFPFFHPGDNSHLTSSPIDIPSPHNRRTRHPFGDATARSNLAPRPSPNRQAGKKIGKVVQLATPPPKAPTQAAAIKIVRPVPAKAVPAPTPAEEKPLGLKVGPTVDWTLFDALESLVGLPPSPLISHFTTLLLSTPQLASLPTSLQITLLLPHLPPHLLHSAKAHVARLRRAGDVISVGGVCEWVLEVERACVERRAMGTGFAESDSDSEDDGTGWGKREEEEMMMVPETTFYGTPPPLSRTRHSLLFSPPLGQDLPSSLDSPFDTAHLNTHPSFASFLSSPDRPLPLHLEGLQLGQSPLARDSTPPRRPRMGHRAAFWEEMGAGEEHLRGEGESPEGWHSERAPREVGRPGVGLGIFGVEGGAQQ